MSVPGAVGENPRGACPPPWTLATPTARGISTPWLDAGYEGIRPVMPRLRRVDCSVRGNYAPPSWPGSRVHRPARVRPFRGWADDWWRAARAGRGRRELARRAGRDRGGRARLARTRALARAREGGVRASGQAAAVSVSGSR